MPKPASSLPFFEKVTVPPPVITPTIPGLVPKEWAAFKKAVIEYNLSLDLYKLDLDWKKANCYSTVGLSCSFFAFVY